MRLSDTFVQNEPLQKRLLCYEVKLWRGVTANPLMISTFQLRSVYDAPSFKTIQISD